MSLQMMIVLARMTGGMDKPWEIKGPFPEFFDFSTVIADMSANPRYDVVTAVHCTHLEEVARLLEEDAVLSKLSPVLCLREMQKAGVFAMPNMRDRDDDLTGGYGEFDDDDDDDDDDRADEDDDALPPFLQT